MPLVQVTYMELREAPRPVGRPGGDQWLAPDRIASERLAAEPYLALYRRVGGPYGWGARLRLPMEELATILASDRTELLVARGPAGEPLGFCEHDRTGFPEVELKHFGLVSEAMGRGLGPRLLDAGLQAEWARGATRIWLHTDVLDHRAALPLYRRAGFRVYQVREEPSELL